MWVFPRCGHSFVHSLQSYHPSKAVAEVWDKLFDPVLDKSSGISAFSPALLLELVLWLDIFLEAGRETVMQHFSPVYTATSVIAAAPVSRAPPFPCYNQGALANPSQPESSSYEISVAFIQLPLCKNYVPQRKFLSGSRVVPWQFECFSLFK